MPTRGKETSAVAVCALGFNPANRPHAGRPGGARRGRLPPRPPRPALRSMRAAFIHGYSARDRPHAATSH
jgi:hypothetical protein